MDLFEPGILVSPFLPLPRSALVQH